MKKLGIYVHIPFCRSKCAYCDFLSSNNLSDESAYLRKLLDEISFYSKKMGDDYLVDTIFIGGGTPSVLSSGNLEKIVDRIKKDFSVSSDAEITIECNPESVNEDKVLELVNSCNRVSLGVQSTCDKTLKIIGRAHDRKKAFNALDLLTKTNLSLSADLILGLPGEDLTTVIRSTKDVLDFGITHLSAYGLSLERGTRLYDSAQKGECNIPDADMIADYYDSVLSVCSQYGLDRYEVSNFAVPGYECKHNLGYWRRKNYLGVGLGAHSLLQNARFYNTRSFDEYLSTSDFDKIKVLDERLEKEDELEETIMLGLRLRDGVEIAEIYEQFGVNVFERYADAIKRLERVLDVTRDNIRVKKEYFYSLNSIIVEFLD